MATGKDLIRKGAKEAAGVATRPKAAEKMAEGVVCKGGQVWDNKIRKCVDAGKLKAAKVLREMKRK
jgi:hypothetical protein